MRERRLLHPVLTRWSGLLIFLGLCLAAGCASLEQSAPEAVTRPGTDVMDVSILEIDSRGAVLRFEIHGGNLASTATSGDVCDYRLITSGRVFAEGAATPFERSSDPGDQTLSFTTRVAYDAIISRVEAVQRGLVLPYEAVVVARTKRPGTDIELRSRCMLPIPDAPRLTVQRINWEGLSSKTAVISLEVDNGNAFSVDLDRLSLSLVMDGSSVFNGEIESFLPLQPGATEKLDLQISCTPGSAEKLNLLAQAKTPSRYDLRGILHCETAFGLLSFPINASGHTPVEPSR